MDQLLTTIIVILIFGSSAIVTVRTIGKATTLKTQVEHAALNNDNTAEALDPKSVAGRIQALEALQANGQLTDAKLAELKAEIQAEDLAAQPGSPMPDLGAAAQKDI